MFISEDHPKMVLRMANCGNVSSVTKHDSTTDTRERIRSTPDQDGGSPPGAPPPYEIPCNNQAVIISPILKVSCCASEVCDSHFAHAGQRQKSGNWNRLDGSWVRAGRYFLPFMQKRTGHRLLGFDVSFTL